MFIQRLTTAIIIAAFFISGVVFLAPEHSALFLAAIWLVGAWEWGAFCRIQSVAKRILYVLSVALLMAITYLVFTVESLLSVTSLFIFSSLCWGVYFLWAQSYPNSAKIWSSQFMSMLIGYTVLVPAWYAMSLLQAHHEYGVALIWVLVLAVANDTGAYLVGKTWGKHKLAKNVSPKKTWEGFFGGVLCAVGLALALGLYFGAELFGGWKVWLVAAVVATFAAVIGDLIESMFKREANIKDSGSILPGHGGVMDRLDSLSAAFPLFALVYFA